MEWFRWYHGACSDAKWPIIARKAKVSVGVVVSVWAALLEYASQDDERGSIEGFDGETYDALYGYEDGTCDAVLNAMMEKGLICGGCICAWRKRQPVREREESTNAERQRRYRERKRQENSVETVTDGDGDVTPRNVTGVTRNAVTPCNASVTPPEKSREEQRRENINTHPLTPSRRERGEGCVLPGEDTPPAPVRQPENLPRERCPDGPAKTDAPSKGSPQWPAFLTCWQVYPVQQGQEAAWREWMRLHRNGTLAPAFVIREAILRLVAEDSRWLRGKVPKMARWLNGKGWDDKPFVEPGGAPALTGFAGRGTQDTRAPTEFQKRQQESRGMASYLLAARKREPHDNDDNEPHWHNAGDAHGTQLDSTTTGRTFAALRAAEIA